MDREGPDVGRDFATYVLRNVLEGTASDQQRRILRGASVRRTLVLNDLRLT